MVNRMKAMSAWLMTLMLLGSGLVYAGPYTDSAHGDAIDGVCRKSPFPDYAVGNCAHCHEQHASIDGAEPAPSSPAGPDVSLVFSDNYENQTTCFCFDCHKGVGSYQSIAFYNYNYSYRAGGDSSIQCPGNILEAFSFIDESGSSVLNCGSTGGTSHKLTDIRNFVNGRWGYSADSNPCTACHDPHRAKRDPYATGNRGWPVSRPSQHADTSTWELYGDELTERMSKYATYQAPRAASGYEPDGSTTQDGSNLTDYVTFCADCHDNSNIIYSNVLVRYLYTFNWNIEKHGNGAASDDAGTDLFPPYQDALCGSYVLACTDCHEPHGAPNIFLTRQKVNNGDVQVYTGTGAGPDGRANNEWVYLCGKCHQGLLADDTHPHDAAQGLNCTTCHTEDRTEYKPCGDCHYHGNSAIYGVPYGEPLF